MEEKTHFFPFQLEEFLNFLLVKSGFANPAYPELGTAQPQLVL
jgi:hypothetical protein